MIAPAAGWPTRATGRSWPTSLEGARLAGADARGADLRQVNLAGSDLIGANLSSVDLRDANTAGSNIDAAILIGARLQH